MFSFVFFDSEVTGNVSPRVVLLGFFSATVVPGNIVVKYLKKMFQIHLD